MKKDAEKMFRKGYGGAGVPVVQGSPQGMTVAAGRMERRHKERQLMKALSRVLKIRPSQKEKNRSKWP